jgi:thymidylate kinase
MENLETQQKVREVYLKYVAKGELTRIDSNKPAEEVAGILFVTVLNFLKTIKPC